MKLNEQFPTPYLSGEDLEGPTIVTIEVVDMVKMVSPKDKKEVARPVVYFVDRRKGIILTEDEDRGEQKQSRVCKQFIEALGTDDTDQWKGKAVQLYPYNLKAFGKDWTVIGVKPAPAGTAPAKPAPGTAPTAPKPPATPPPAKEPVLNPAQIAFRDTLKRTFTHDELNDGTAAEEVGKAIVTALGPNYQGDDWRTLSPVQLSLVADALKVPHPPTPRDFDELPDLPRD